MILATYIKDALNSEINYSLDFTKAIATLANDVSEKLNCNVYHDTDMNYRAAQSISFNVLEKEPYSLNEKGGIEIRIYVSSRAKLFCFYCFDKKGKFHINEEWSHPAPLEAFPPQIQKLFTICRSVLNEKGYKEVEIKWFNEPAPNCFTELDGIPASVFQVLFAEIV